MIRPARLTPMIPGWAWLWCPTRRGALVGMTVAIDDLDQTMLVRAFRLVAADGVGGVA